MALLWSSHRTSVCGHLSHPRGSCFKLSHLHLALSHGLAVGCVRTHSPLQERLGGTREVGRATFRHCIQWRNPCNLDTNRREVLCCCRLIHVDELPAEVLDGAAVDFSIAARVHKRLTKLLVQIMIFVFLFSGNQRSNMLGLCLQPAANSGESTMGLGSRSSIKRTPHTDSLFGWCRYRYF